MMRIYSVGGAVRDELLGRPVRDRDWVVVGATPDEMLEQGFRPVGKDFPVFLHPDTGEEYALARTERKTGRGYKGFSFHTSPDVTLEDDLARRDLTINAMARAADGSLVDPWGGRADIERRVLRHVGTAFAEDPLRILRVARFAARFDDFTLAPETQTLMRAMVDEDEVEELVAERVWQELARGLMEDHPARMLLVLHSCGALGRLFPAIAASLGRAPDPGTPPLAVLDHCATQCAPLAVRWACLLRASGLDADTALRYSEVFKAPNDCRDLALLLVRNHAVLSAPPDTPERALDTLHRVDALRRPERFDMLLQACAHAALRSDTPTGFPAGVAWRAAADCVAGIDAGAIAARCSNKADIPARIREARLAALADGLPAAPPVSS